MKQAQRTPRVGDRVIVQFGGYDKEGEVVHVSRTLTPAMLTVDVWLEGGDEPLRSTYRADRVRPAEPVKQ